MLPVTLVNTKDYLLIEESKEISHHNDDRSW